MVGASGTVLGFVGLTVLDVLLNIPKKLFLCLRLIIILAALIFFIITVATKASSLIWSIIQSFSIPKADFRKSSEVNVKYVPAFEVTIQFFAQSHPSLLSKADLLYENLGCTAFEGYLGEVK